jgi:hypothetical protein
MAVAQKTMLRIGAQLVANAKSMVTLSSKSGSVEKNDIVGRDLLSLLVRANMASDLKESQKMLDEDVLARTSIHICHLTTPWFKQMVLRDSDISCGRT